MAGAGGVGDGGRWAGYEVEVRDMISKGFNHYIL